MWVAIIIYMVLVVVGFKLFIKSDQEFKKNNPKTVIFCLLLLAFLLRIFLAIENIGHADMECFGSWARRIVEIGPKNFYAEDIFTDYPPGYIGILWIVGLLQKLFQTTPGFPFDHVLIKLPAMLFDMILGYLLIRVARKKLGSKQAVFLGAAYLFAPAVLFNSAVWGQVDAVFTLFVILIGIYLMRGDCEYTYIPFMIGVLIKPQMLMFAPVLLLGMVEHVLIKFFSWKKVARNALFGICALMGSAFFASLFDISTVLSQYKNTMSSYPYASVNAYNFWGMMGKNWVSQNQLFLGIKYITWGYTGIVIAFFLVGSLWYYHIYNKKENNYFFLASIFLFTIFTFSVRMHERYIFPMMILLLFAYIYSKEIKILVFNLLLSFVHFLNVVHVFYKYEPSNYNEKDFGIISISILMVLLFLIYLFYTFIEIKKQRCEVIHKNGSVVFKNDDQKIEIGQTEEKPEEFHKKMQKKDWIILSIIMLMYIFISLFHLGDRKVPTSGDCVPYHEGIYIDLPSLQDTVTIQYYLGNLENRRLNLYLWDAGIEEWIFEEEITMVSVYRWGEFTVSKPCKNLCLMVLDTSANVLEMAAKDANGNELKITTSDNAMHLVDEPSLVPKYRSYLNGTIFDEIYYARTAHEMIYQLPTYEWTHPPLGKIIISLGIRVFGMNPFGWRIPGAIFGIIMLPLFYVFSKRIFKRVWVAALTTILLASDFMHFTQTRIATIDVFVVFFIIGMYYYMFCYYSEPHTNENLKSNWRLLALSGLFMGLAISCKWTGAYAAIGLAIIFFLALFKKDWKTKRFMKTIVVCNLFFLVIPVLLYTCFYIPVVRHDGAGLFERMWRDQPIMLAYHNGVHAKHPYASLFYQWPVVYRPILYYIRVFGENMGETISCFGNPLIWWSGIPAFFYLVYSTIKKKNETALFLVVGYLAQYVPWMFVNRTLFIYHYFPSVPFVILMIGYVMTDVVKKNKKAMKWCFVYAAVSVLLFILFYPVLSGYPVDKEYVNTWLRWFDSWVISI